MQEMTLLSESRTQDEGRAARAGIIISFRERAALRLASRINLPFSPASSARSVGWVGARSFSPKSEQTLRALKAFVYFQIARWDGQGRGDGVARLDSSPHCPCVRDNRRSSAELHPSERFNAMPGFQYVLLFHRLEPFFAVVRTSTLRHLPHIFAEADSSQPFSCIRFKYTTIRYPIESIR